MAVSSFAPEFLELFKRAAQEEFIIPLGDHKRAMHLRFRLNMLRKDMRKEKHTLVIIANSVQFSITDDGDLRCAPADASFLDELAAAGITIDAPSPSINTPTIPYAKPEQADAEEVLKKFFHPKDKG